MQFFANDYGLSEEPSMAATGALRILYVCVINLEVFMTRVNDVFGGLREERTGSITGSGSCRRCFFFFGFCACAIAG